jgi:hypothetical protein
MGCHVTVKANVFTGAVPVAVTAVACDVKANVLAGAVPAATTAAAHPAAVDVTYDRSLRWTKLHGEWRAEVFDGFGTSLAAGVGDKESALLELADELMPPD